LRTDAKHEYFFIKPANLLKGWRSTKTTDDNAQSAFLLKSLWLTVNAVQEEVVATV
jgi:hypothetical protein